MSDGRALPLRGRSAAELLASATGGASGDRRSLARLLSIAEQGGPVARDLARLTYPRSGSAYSIGLTGAPGAGKSTLTARLIAEALTQTGQPVAVLAIDPSSPLSGGAILGDRVRMQDHALDEGVYIRSMASRGHLGGLAAAVPDAVRVFDAAGWPLVFVETVGVGQIEVEVAASCDTVIVVLNPGWGDAVQANKAGLLEVADVLVINKADRPGVRETKRDLVGMLQLSHGLDWMPPIVETVATDGNGIHELWSALCSHRAHLEATGGLARRRTARLVEETERLAAAQLAKSVAEELRQRGSQLIEALAAHRTNPAEAADEVVSRIAARLAEPDLGTDEPTGAPVGTDGAAPPLGSA
ncbi:MAG TPA: methylmalonyl Co-A mutase-associated GTPase MeaB [Acidimicrobiales bacterium]|nr:methylmalonyl Co-A mutase-associated GTPase MeaB [Acidimicrobiales bacterium]